MLRGLIFDMDGVIVDNSDMHVQAYAIFLKRYGVTTPFTPDLFGRRNEQILQMMLPAEIYESKGWRALSEEKEEVYRETFRDEIKPTAGLLSLLECAKSNDIKCGIGSSACRLNVEFTMDITSIRNYIDAWCCEDDVCNGKPNPEVYINTAAKMGLKPEECIVFEDATVGITAGKSAGCKVVALTTSNSREVLQQTEADLIIDDFRDITIEQLQSLFD